MKFSTILASTAIVSLTLFTDIGATIGTNTVTAAQAATSVSVSLFYNDLGDSGDWVRYNDDYVFVPQNVRSGWRPYTDGHWVFTADYGWTWISDEPFGWATYHYGRWGYAETVGWYWVPGTRWAPAWVSWRRDRDHVVWAPLPPSRRGDDVNISISVGDIPDNYWVAVPTRSFLSVDLRVNIINDDRERRRIVRNTKFLGTPRVRNNIVVNNVIDVNVIEKETGQKVRRVRAQRVDNPEQARGSNDQVRVFDGEIKADTKAKPTRVKEVAEVRKNRKENRGQTGQDSAAGSDQNNADSNATADSKKKKPASNGNAGAADRSTASGKAATDNTTNDTQPVKRKKRNTTEQTNKSTGAANSDATGTVEQPNDGTVSKAKRKKPVASEVDQSGSSNNADDAQSRKKGRKAVDRSNNSQPDAASNGQANKRKKAQPAVEQGQENGNGKKKGKNKQCDPQTDATCTQ